jgi:hypothetical protein
MNPSPTFLAAKVHFVQIDSDSLAVDLELGVAGVTLDSI